MNLQIATDTGTVAAQARYITIMGKIHKFLTGPTGYQSSLPALFFCILLTAGSAVAEEAWIDPDYEKVHKWDFTGENPHCVSFDFENGHFDVEGLSTKRLVGAWSAVPDSDRAREDRYSARFELRPGDRVSGGWRAELRDLNNAKPGSVVWYSISTLIPEDFAEAPGNSFVLIQWHDQKVPWNNPMGHSPPLAARYRDGRLDITLRHAFDGQRDGENGRELNLYSHPDLERGVWHDFVYQVKWSANAESQDTGFVNVWLNGEQVVDYDGPIGYFDDLGVYVKFGIYARHDVDRPYVVFHDSYHRGVTFEDVCVVCEPLTGNDIVDQADEK